MLKDMSSANAISMTNHLQIIFTTPEILRLQNGRDGHKNLKVSRSMELSNVMMAKFHDLKTYSKNLPYNCSPPVIQVHLLSCLIHLDSMKICRGGSEL
jgi:hypothetical protein